MKDFVKMIGLVVIGVLTAAIIYPFLHEAGHSLIALLVGAKVADFNLLPIPFVICEVSPVDLTGQILIGLGGIVFPFVLSMSLQPKQFWIWYANLILQGISVCSVILSVIAIVLHINGNSWQSEDIVQILRIFPNGTWLFLLVMCIMGTYGLIRLWKEKAFSRCIDYFDPTKKAII